MKLWHFPSGRQSRDDSHKRDSGQCAHSYRGIATLTYIINGEVEHADSIGNQVNLNSGCVHWMKAGRGVVHDEAIYTEGKSETVSVAQC